MKQAILFVCAVMCTLVLNAQLEMEVVAEGLAGPIGIEMDSDGNLWVAESGSGMDDGAVTVIWANGTQQQVIEGLPSVFDTMTMETLGAWRVHIFNDQYIGVVMGEGLPEIGSSILVFARDSIIPGGEALGLSDAQNVIDIKERVSDLGFEESNTFSFVQDGEDLYIVDAAANAILHRDGLTGVMTPFASFPDIPTSDTSHIDPVPTRIIHNPEGGFYVSQLTGFPFLTGLANIFSVDSAGTVAVVDSGFTLLTDLAIDQGGDGLLALQYASFSFDSVPPFWFGSSLITQIHSDGTKDTIASGFGPSAGMVQSPNGEFFATMHFTGMVMKFSPMSTSIHDAGYDPDAFKIFPNPVEETFSINWKQPYGGEVEAQLIGLDGKVLSTRSLGYHAAGEQQVNLTRSDFALDSRSPQPMVISVQSDKMQYSGVVLFQ